MIIPNSKFVICHCLPLDAEALQMDSVRALLPRFEAKIQRVLDRVWGNGAESP